MSKQIDKENTFITKTTALKKYHLTQKDIANLKFTETTNPHYKCAPDMILYRLSDIIEVFDNKYDNDYEDINIKLAELDHAKQEQKENNKVKREKKFHLMKNNPNIIKILSAKKKLTKNERLILLEKKLKEFGLELRVDSKLCMGFIDGSIDWNIDDIVQRMAQMKYLFEYCDITHYIELAKKT